METKLLKASHYIDLQDLCKVSPIIGDIHKVYNTSKLTKMARKRCLPPGLNLWNPWIQYHDWRNAPYDKNSDKEHDEAPGGDTELGAVERLERKPSADVHEARAVQKEVDD